MVDLLVWSPCSACSFLAFQTSWASWCHSWREYCDASSSSPCLAVLTHETKKLYNDSLCIYFAPITGYSRFTRSQGEFDPLFGVGVPLV